MTPRASSIMLRASRSEGFSVAAKASSFLVILRISDGAFWRFRGFRFVARVRLIRDTPPVSSGGRGRIPLCCGISLYITIWFE